MVQIKVTGRELISKLVTKRAIFLLINAPGAMQNIDREPLVCTQFTKQKVCPILYFGDD